MANKPQTGNTSFRYLAILLGFIWIATVGLTAVDAKPLGVSIMPGPTVSSGSNTSGQNESFVGKETCLTCHQDLDKELEKTLHGKSAMPGSPASSGELMCETCHGPGKAHVDSGDKKDIKSFSRLSARDSTQACMTCHEQNTSHFDWASSMHAARNVSCASCHSVHNPKSEAQLKTVRASDTCSTCHKDKALKNRKSSHMPVNEGKMECSTCHSPHGSTGEKMLRTGFTASESCVSCHTEKRGPFLWEHAPVSNNCTTCHEPHGTNNASMLKQKLPFLCQTCHVNTRHPPTIYDGNQINNASNRILGNSCVNCHSQVHGSNHPSGRRFLR